jgi:hypothetical protein
LTNRRPDAHRSSNPASNASPADTTVCTEGSASASSTANTAGGNVTCVTPWRDISSTSPAPGINSSAEATTRVAPQHHAITTSDTAASNATDANCNTRAPGCTPNRSICATARFANPPWATATPLGAPVDPDV